MMGKRQAPWPSCLHPPLRAWGTGQKGGLPGSPPLKQEVITLAAACQTVILATMMLSGRGVATALRFLARTSQKALFLSLLNARHSQPKGPGAQALSKC